MLDVASLKPDADKSEDVFQGRKTRKGLFDSSTVMVTRPNEASTSSSKQLEPINCNKKNASEASVKPSRQKKLKKSGQTIIQDQSNERMVDSPNPLSDACASTSEGLKRKGDLEFEIQMEMALAATATATKNSELNGDTDIKNINSSPIISPFKKLKTVKCVESESSSHGVSTAIGSRRTGAPLYWAEVYCSGENSTGKWVHVDVVNAIIDGEQNVEAAAAACKTSLRYVVAFAGRGAKDVTRRLYIFPLSDSFFVFLR